MASEKQAPYLRDLSLAYADYAKSQGFDFDTFDSTDAILNKMSTAAAHDFISKLVEYANSAWGPWKPLTRQAVAAELAYQYCKVNNHSQLRRSMYPAITKIAAMIGFQGEFRPLVFSKNENGSRVPMTVYEAEDNFQTKQLSAVKEVVNKRLVKDGAEDLPDDEAEDQEEIPEDDAIPEEAEPEPEPEDEGLGVEFEAAWERYVFLREYTETRDVGGHQIDTLERRPYIAMANMMIHGIPKEAAFDAMTMHWPAEVRRELGIETYDVREFRKDQERPAGMPPEFNYLCALRNAKVNPWLISPAGVGKTTIVRKFAEHFGQAWCVIPLNRGTSPSAFNGRPKLTNTSLMIQFLKAMAGQDESEMTRLAKIADSEGDVAISEFTRVFTGGGHILLDEIDAGDENLLMMVNAPLANGIFANTAEGKTHEIHPDTLIWAASNTMGLGVSAGAGREYRGRNALDFATIDRFRMGRIKMKGDVNDYRKHFEQMILANR